MEDWKYKKFVAETVNGGVCVLEPEEGFHGSREDFLRETSLDLAENWAELEAIQLPCHKEYQDAWRLVDGAIEIDMDKAREIHIDILRQKRDDELIKLDIDSLRCLEESDYSGLEIVKRQKQKLRDMPDDPIFNVDTFEELVRAIPAYLED